ncbi:stealth family protein [Dokdonella immobilis]|uniref:Stealth protein CR1, conserved region 1 n=1 Tax=Dokdonella immobilis TaxID=578942 RepID=A0A1I5A5V7_9GAMM|nr:stealth family protein [Dokdonella immobilis]SFN57589.1 Stealth protein CR1, conserved region 1 [Dokdonella immobilis]
MNIDAVITWVDGADPAHRQRLDAYLAGIGKSRPASAERTRFNDAGEIDWCVRSILRFAPWFRRIHIVADGQRPRILERLAGTPHAGRFRVVDHAEIFRGHEHALPTFNSRSIITMLWRIEDLAEHFVYFNDDMFLLREVAPEDFFRDGKVVQRGYWRPQTGHGAFARLASWIKHKRGIAETRVGNLESQQLSARLAGFEDRYYRHYHNPYPLRRSTLEAFFAEHPEMLEGNAGYRLRSSEQFKAEVVASHLELASDNAHLDNRLHVVQLKPSEQLPMRVRRKMRKADADPNAAFVCVQSLEMAPEPVQREIAAWLDRRIGADLALPGAGAQSSTGDVARGD